MIQNVIFDMGNVLLRWDPQYIVSRFTGDPEAQRQIRAAIFEDPDWAAQDAGAISEDEMRDHIRGRLPEALHEVALNCFDAFEQYMSDIPETQALVAELRAAGRRIYLLSNANVRFWDYLNGREFFRGFDGIVISARERLVKPDVRLYRLMMERYGLKPEECLFIDDMPANVAGAEAAGMAALRFDGNVNALREKMSKLGAFAGTSPGAPASNG